MAQEGTSEEMTAALAVLCENMDESGEILTEKIVQELLGCIPHKDIEVSDLAWVIRVFSAHAWETVPGPRTGWFTRNRVHIDNLIRTHDDFDEGFTYHHTLRGLGMIKPGSHPH